MLSIQQQNHIDTLLQKIKEADAIIVGGASGMSTAAGFNWYEEGGGMWENFKQFGKNDEVRSLWEALYYPYSTSEERWGLLTSLIHFLYASQPGQPYLDLYHLIKEKNYFIVTTNQDFQFTKVFPEEKISSIQGDWRYFQCKNRCHDQVYDNKEYVQEVYKKLEGTKIPVDTVPRCPKCGEEMVPWIRSADFLEGHYWYGQIQKLQNFIMKNKYKKLLFLELGVGSMTPKFIQEPFWEMTETLPQAFYISINPEETVIPEGIKEKGFAIQDDIAYVFQDARKENKNKTEK